ncbi:MAG TPA: prolyl oligopeptidase family serine peptidase, partial [Candidatus Eisenbacteria bacterium]|nr:prolyl oligopeptidase family serine peptidase [Candidatus Eisenbacteria bacterium]
MRLAIVPLLVLSLAGALTARAAERDHVPIRDDYFTINFATSCVPSPDGRFAAYTEQRWEGEDDPRNTDLWVADLTAKSVTRLTFEPGAEGSAEWSPDSKWIYFTGSKKSSEGKVPENGKTQVWRIAREGGTALAVTRLDEGVNGFHLSPDGKALYYTAGAEHIDEDVWKDLRKDFKKLQYGHGVTTFSEVWKLDLETWRAEKLVDSRRVIVDWAVSPDERRIAMITRPDEELITNEGWTQVDLYDMSTRKITTLPDKLWRADAPSPYGWLLGTGWSSDSRVLSFRVDFDGYPGEIFFAHFDQGAEPVLQKLVRPREVTPEGGMRWIPGTRTFTFTAADHARQRVIGIKDVRAGRQGGDMDLTVGDVEIDDYGFSTRGSLVVLKPGLDHPPDLFVVKNGSYERITRLNPQVDTWKLGKLQIVKWTAPDGSPVEGILELPPDYKAGDPPLPLLLTIHGGPTSASTLAFAFSIYGRGTFAPEGWAVFDPNYRGSTGYGDKFLTDLIGRENDIEVKDILAGVDALIERGIADPQRMAVMGWSNGGFLTNCIITQDPRFRAASSGAGVF